MEPFFPLFQLPENAIINVIKNLNLEQLFFVSLVSSKTKILVRLLRLEASDVNIRIDSSIEVVMYTRTFENLVFRSSRLINFCSWMNRVRTIFYYTPPPTVRFYPGCEKFEVQSLIDAIGDVNDLYVSRLVTDVMSRKVLKQFNTPNELFLEWNPFEEASEAQKKFIQNSQRIVFYDFFSLDDMLLVNSEKGKFTHPISQKQFNQFVKHWIRGSNPRLQYMSLSIDATDFANEKVYLKGIKCIEMSEDAKREIRQEHNLSANIYMIQIRRKDGTFAVIGTHKSKNTLYVHFVVQH